MLREFKIVQVEATTLECSFCNDRTRNAINISNLCDFQVDMYALANCHTSSDLLLKTTEPETTDNSNFFNLHYCIVKLLQFGG